MRPGTKIVRIVMVAFFLTAIAYFGAYTYHVLFRGVESARLYSYSAEDTIEFSLAFPVLTRQTIVA